MLCQLYVGGLREEKGTRLTPYSLFSTPGAGASRTARNYCPLNFYLPWSFNFIFPIIPLRSGELRTQKLKSHLVRIQSLNVLPLKPGVGQ